MPRREGATSFTTSPSIFIVPLVMSSSPAIRRSRVDFPQPDGPTNTTNSPDWMSRSTPLITCTAPNDLVMALRLTSAILTYPQSTLHGAREQPADEESLQRQEHDERHDDRHERR